MTTTTAEDRGDDTAAGAFDRAEPPPPQAATSALPSTGADSPDDVTDSTASLEILAAAGTPVVGSLIHGLEIVLPPEVATALASPLIVVELLLGALLDSGGAVLIPSLLLSLVVASILTPGPGVISLGTRWRRTRGVGHSSSEQLSSPGGAR